VDTARGEPQPRNTYRAGAWTPSAYNRLASKRSRTGPYAGEPLLEARFAPAHLGGHALEDAGQLPQRTVPRTTCSRLRGSMTPAAGAKGIIAFQTAMAST
jgi:hypothetical protein